MSPSITFQLLSKTFLDRLLSMLTFVWFALLPELSRSFNSSFTSIFFEIFIRHDFTTHKFILKITVDDTSSLRRFSPLSYRPRANFVRSTGEVTDELTRKWIHSIHRPAKGDLHQGWCIRFEWSSEEHSWHQLFFLLPSCLQATSAKYAPQMRRRTE